MLRNGQLKQLAHKQGTTQKDQLLLLLVSADGAQKVAALKKAAASAGIKWAKQANVSDRLSKLKGLAIRTDEGWELTDAGRDALASTFPEIVAKTRIDQYAKELHGHVAKLSSAETRRFLEEAIACCEAKLWRAAVVLSWCGAVAVLQDYVVNKHLSAFNTEAVKHDPKWKSAKTTDDLSNMKEHTFLERIAAISIIGKNVKKELQDCLALRNGCGHPNSLQIAEARVVAHLEILTLNVFGKF